MWIVQQRDSVQTCRQRMSTAPLHAMHLLVALTLQQYKSSLCAELDILGELYGPLYELIGASQEETEGRRIVTIEIRST